ncbi:MAG: carbohydrate-binding domain-containing protein [Oscillibacter sp.]|nr:carbohydrate-binding domain-containing protein [Oscillibacter sp.]
MDKKKLLSAFALTALFITLCASAASAAESVAYTFSDTGITASDGSAIAGTALTIDKAGTYIVTGSCKAGSITVKKETAGVTLNLQDLSLTSATTAPLVCGKSSEVTLNVSGTVVLTDKESLANEESDDFEGAAINVKSGASLTIAGGGTLTADGSACKNGIKGGAGASVTVGGGATLVVKAANNGLASDGSVKIDGGTVTITADGDGLKAEPEEGDADSAGTVLVNEGTLTINAGDDGIQAANGVTVSGGTIGITSAGDGISCGGGVKITNGKIQINATGGDGIQTAANLTISGGTFDITTFGGYGNVNALGDKSGKGLKASSDAETPTNKITISGGTFALNTADDAIHSDCDATITGGQFTIRTGDDGAHADNVLTLGEKGGKDPALQFAVSQSYEGLEGTTVNILSGCYDVATSDDGINAAGGSSKGFDPGGPGGDRFRGFAAPRLQGNAEAVRYDSPRPQDGERVRLFADSSAAINISGGVVKVNAGGDGLDANGALNLTGGNIVVWGQQAGYDNQPLDYDGTFTVKGATVFAAGGRAMGAATPASGSQAYVSYQGSNIGVGKIIHVKDGEKAVVVGIAAPKIVNYAFFSSPTATTAWSISSGSGSETANCAVTGHTWDGGTETKEATCAAAGTMLYACAVCGETESIAIPATGHHYSSGRCTYCGADDPDTEGEAAPETSGYAVSFKASHASVAVYKTSTISEETADSSGAYYARAADTGNIVTGGTGQCNFVVTVAEGYKLVSVAASPADAYGSLVTVDEGKGAYRVTKITGNVAVTVTTEAIVSKAGFSYALDGTSATVKLGYEKTEGATENASYTVCLAWYDEEGQLVRFYVAEKTTLDGDKYAELAAVTFPEKFAHCYAFLLDADYKPQTDKMEVTAAET